MDTAEPEGELPPYANRLDLLHRALRDEFASIIGRLPLDDAGAVLDAGCGDGFFTRLIGERLADGVAVGLDNSPAYLHQAEARAQQLMGADRVRFVHGCVEDLPFPDESMSVVLSAHSMQSYPDHPRALGEFRRVLRPNGTLAVLETDNIHSIMLSWPPDVELAVRRAEHREIGSEDSYRGTYFPRFARGLLNKAGFASVSQRFHYIHRQAPADPWLAKYVQFYLESLIESVGDDLSDAMATRLRALASPDSPRFLPRQDNFFFGSLQVLTTAARPSR